MLLATEPANGATWDGGAVVFTFDKAMGDAQIAVAPALAGATSIDGPNVTFTASVSPQPNTRYRFAITAATAQDGSALAADVGISLQSAGPLTVASTQPSDGAEDADPNAAIVVLFNRPVVPLMGIEDQGGLPQPLTLTPAVDGTGAWISTSVYRFQPSGPLAGATSYQATVDALTAIDGATMAEPYTFQFRTAAPIVLGAKPAGILVPPDTGVQITFSQPMDHPSTEAAFSLVASGDDSRPVKGKFTWNPLNTTVVFTPTAPLTFGAEYSIQVTDSALAQSKQGHLDPAYSSSFTVVPLPAVADSTILNGAEGVNPENELRIRFTAPVSENLLLANITIAPLVSGTQVVSYTYTDYYEATGGQPEMIQQGPPFGYNTNLTLNWYKQPNTPYTVTIGGAVADPYGNTLGDDYVLRFTTGDYSPLLQIDLDRFTHYSAYTTTVVGVKYRNVDTVNAELFSLPLNDLYLLGGENQWEVWDKYEPPNQAENRIWSRSYETEGEPNVINIQGIKLTDSDNNPLPPGVYLLEVRNPPGLTDNAGQPSVQKAVIVLTNDNLLIKRGSQGSSLAWMTGLQSGQPQASAPIVFTKNGVQLAQARTDVDGVALAELGLTGDELNAPIFAATGQPGDADFAVVSSAWSEGIEPWSFDLSSGGSYDQAVIDLYTDRPIYRPGQTVYWKGIVRVLKDDEWQLPNPGQTLLIKVSDTLGNSVFQREYTVNDNGTIHGDFPLAPDAVTGYYSIGAEMNVEGSPTFYGNASFQVAAYRKPEFQVTVTTDQPEYIQGDLITITAQANYFSGGPLANAPVEWSIIADRYSFTWKDAPAGRYYSFDPFDPEQVEYNPYGGFLGLVQQGKGVTNADGAFTLEIPADLGTSIASQTWSVDVVVTSPTNQPVYANARFPVHRGQYYIGLSPRSYVAEAGAETTVDVVTVTPDGQRYPNAELESVVYQVQWNSVYEQAEDGNYYWKTSVQRTPVMTTSVTTNEQGEGVVSFTPEQGGQYEVSASGQDAAGNSISSAVYRVGQLDGRRVYRLATGEQRPHGAGGGQEALRPRRHGAHPRARSLPGYSQGPGDRRAQRRARRAGHRPHRQQPDHRHPDRRRIYSKRLRQRDAGQGRG